MIKTANEFLKHGTKSLVEAGITSARLDCLILLEDALNLDRAAILAHPEAKISPAKLVKLNKQVTQRAKHIPLAYIRGRVHFFGREFLVDDHVLVPRPETETMIEMLKKLPLNAHTAIADIGTGTGCIGITAAIELPDSKVTLYDIDAAALKVAAKNVQAFGLEILTTKSDLLDNLTNTDVVLANLPYVPESYAINDAAKHEPKRAIFSGKDGLSLYHRFWVQISALKYKPKFVLTESLPGQHDDVAKLAHNAGYELQETREFIQVFRPV